MDVISTSETLSGCQLQPFQTFEITGANVTVTVPSIAEFDDFIVEAGATVVLDPCFDLECVTLSGGTAVINETTSFLSDVNVSFGSGTNNLIVDPKTEGGCFENDNLLSGINISGLNIGDNIDFQNSGSPISGVSLQYQPEWWGGGDTEFSVKTTDGTETFKIAGNYTADHFVAVSDGNGGFDFRETAPCFLAGTKILTDLGEMPVEQLKAGDVVILHDFKMAKIKFVGYRHINPMKHQKPDVVYPVKIPAGALADGLPCRDLFVSPDHALFFNGCLVEAKRLIDGMMIKLDRSARIISYYHIELDFHGVLIAEGVHAESYLDCGQKGLFENAEEPMVLHPDMMNVERTKKSAFPVLTTEPELIEIRKNIQARALKLGFVIRDKKTISLDVGGKILFPCESDGEYVFELPSEATQAVLKSGSFVPAEIDPHSFDNRRLGVAIAWIKVNGNMMMPKDMFDHSDIFFGEGDPSIWTNGEAKLALPEGVATISMKIVGLPKSVVKVAA